MNDQDAIQEKFYPPRFIQVPENMSIEEGRFCRMDFKVRENFKNTGEKLTMGYQVLKNVLLFIACYTA